MESFNARFRDGLLNGELFLSFERRRSFSKAGGATTAPHEGMLDAMQERLDRTPDAMNIVARAWSTRSVR